MLSAGYGATISAPHMHAWCLELLSDRLRPGSQALDVGSGSGYFTVLMAAMMAAGVEDPAALSHNKVHAAGPGHVYEELCWRRGVVWVGVPVWVGGSKIFAPPPFYNSAPCWWLGGSELGAQ